MNNHKYDIARNRVKKRLKFRSHLVSYVVICSFLFAINIFTSAGPDFLWAIWPAMGWGVAIAFHGFEAYGIIPDKEKEEELIEKEFQRLEQGNDENLVEEDQLDLSDLRKEARYNEEDFV